MTSSDQRAKSRIRFILDGKARAPLQMKTKISSQRLMTSNQVCKLICRLFPQQQMSERSTIPQPVCLAALLPFAESPRLSEKAERNQVKTSHQCGHGAGKSHQGHASNAFPHLLASAQKVQPYG